jgi:hypothetical protein
MPSLGRFLAAEAERRPAIGSQARTHVRQYGGLDLERAVTEHREPLGDSPDCIRMRNSAPPAR